MKKLLLLATVMIVYGCPSESCNEIDFIAEQYDLVEIGPLQDQISQGTVITLSLEIPATNSYFGQQINLYDKTGDDTGTLIFTGPELFTGNDLNFIKGFVDRDISIFGVTYNPITEVYELQIEITLNKLGIYRLDALHRIDFIGSNCVGYSISTSTEGTLIEDISFEVVP